MLNIGRLVIIVSAIGNDDDCINAGPTQTIFKLFSAYENSFKFLILSLFNSKGNQTMHCNEIVCLLLEIPGDIFSDTGRSLSLPAHPETTV